jgi:hypothetical protein
MNPAMSTPADLNPILKPDILTRSLHPTLLYLCQGPILDARTQLHHHADSKTVTVHGIMSLHPDSIYGHACDAPNIP